MNCEGGFRLVAPMLTVCRRSGRYIDSLRDLTRGATTPFTARARRK